jgi:hypothetical protein
MSSESNFKINESVERISTRTDSDVGLSVFPDDVLAEVGDILAQIFATEHVHDFEELIDDVRTNRQQSNDSEYGDDELIIRAAGYRLCRFEIVMRIILEHLKLPWKQAFTRTTEQLEKFTPTMLAWLYFLCRNPSLMRFLVGAQIELEETMKAMISRTAEVDERKLLVSFLESNSSSTDHLLRAIKREATKWSGRAATRLYQPYRRADEEEDRRQTALQELMNSYRTMGEDEFQDLKRNYPVLRMPRIRNVPLADRKNELALDEVRQEYWENDIELMVRKLLPILKGEKLLEKAYQGFREHDRKFEAQKRAAEEVQLQEEHIQKPPIIVRERGSGTWKLDEERLDKLEAMGLLSSSETQAPVSMSLEIAFRTVIENRRTKRTKEKARVFIDELKDHWDVTQATKAAQLTRDARKQILLELRHELNRTVLHTQKK